MRAPGARLETTFTLNPSTLDYLPAALQDVRRAFDEQEEGFGLRTQ